MTRLSCRLLASLAAVLAFTPLPAFAEFLAPDWSELVIEGVAPPDWSAGVNDGDYVGMCVACDGSLMLEVRVVPDDGTGGRVHSGETTVETYTRIGQSNAEQLGNGAAYYGTKAVTYASAKGFRTSARGATGDYSSTYQLWSDGQQLLVRVFGENQSQVKALARKAYEAAAPLTFR